MDRINITKLFGRCLGLISSIIWCLASVDSSLAENLPQRLLVPIQSEIVVAGGSTGTIETFCLDSERDTPDLGYSYSGAPSNLGSINVSVGGRAPIPLQQALTEGRISLTSSGTFLSLQIKNNTDEQVKISVDHVSVLLPNSNDVSADLHEVIDAVAKLGPIQGGSLTINTKIWDIRDSLTYSALGIRTDTLKDGDREFDLNLDLMNQYQKLSGMTKQASGAVAAAVIPFIVQRLEPNTRGKSRPKYVLYTGSSKPSFYDGNVGLSTLMKDIRARWSGGQRGSRKPNVLLVGEGSSSDFDAAAITMGIANSPEGAVPDLSFVPPGGTLPPVLAGAAYGGGAKPPVPLPYKRDGKRRSITQTFERGWVQVLAVSETMVGHMAAAVRSVLDSDVVKQPHGSTEVRDLIYQDVQEAVRATIAEEPALAVIEKGNTEVRLLVDALLGNRVLVAIRFDKGRPITQLSYLR